MLDNVATMTRLASLIAFSLIALALLFSPELAEADWPTWGDNEVADCTFAAAANWETLVGLRVRATTASLVHEFHRAGGTPTEGATEAQLARYWEHHGIGGHRARLIPRRHVAAHTIAGLELWPGEEWRVVNPASDEGAAWNVGPEHGRGGHMVVVVAVGSRGPIVLSWGAWFQLTWHQWRLSHPLIWSITPLR